MIMILRDLRTPAHARETSLRRDEAGNALVELAAVTPMLLLLAIGAFDFGRVFYTAMAVTGAAHAGAQYGAQSVGKAEDQAGMVQAALDSSPDLGISATASESPVCRCATGSATVDCDTTDSACLPLRVYASVTASRTFTTIVNYPGIPHSVPISRTAQIRAQ
jgi:Flp pilus assembly protein TadG